jgi:cobalt/nickel transport system permease protein
MRCFRIPHIFIVMFEMTYRYIGVLVTEAYSMFISYSLRNASAKGIVIKDMGCFTGQLLLRSFDRADRVYNAMKCRGYASSITSGYASVYTSSTFSHNSGNFKIHDFIFCLVVCLPCIALRIIDINTLFIEIFARFA